MSEELHPGLHPNADALSAFLEGVLPEHERAECLTHLANCAQCREVVFLAREAAETEEPAAAKEAAVPFWRKLLRPMPVLAAAATAVLFFSVGLYRVIRSAEQKPMVIAEAKPVPAPRAEPEISTQVVPQAARNAVDPLKSVPSTTVQPTPRKASPPPVVVERTQAQAEAVAPSPALPITPPTSPSLTPAPAQVAVAAGPPVPAAAQFAAAPRAAEATGAGVAGTITDRTGAAISLARVELKNDDTGAIYMSASDARGQFRIGGLAPGRYDLSVTSMGFQKFMRPSIELQPETIARVDSTLDIGTATETVTVAAQPPLLKTEGGAVATTGNIAAADLPLNRAITYQLPGKKPAVTFAAKDRVVVAADAEGALFFSDNQGKNWKHIKGKWKGKVVRVVSPPSVPGNTNVVFELITDPASTWVSTDGRNWTAAPASR